MPEDTPRPDLYLCLDLEPAKPEHIHDLPDDFLFGTNLAGLLTHPAVNGDRWVREWRALTDRDEALRYQQTRPTVVIVPLRGEAIPSTLID